jgi:ParB family transcriptional regulator, chromosome partitioning protein
MGEGVVARKNLLAGLTDSKLPAGNLESHGEPGTIPLEAARRVPAPLPGFGSGAIGAVSRSIEQIKAQIISELDPTLIEPSPISDRLETSTQALEQLVTLIRENGQQVPILVRPHPEKPGRYQIAYGRRRLSACIALDRKVRAMIKPLTDQELVVAQGQENSARTDLSFIERAQFAARLEQGGYSRDVIMAALSVDKTGLSRLISSAIKIPRSLIEAVGPAPKAGRDRWVELAARLEAQGAMERAQAVARGERFQRGDSDERFNLVFTATAAPSSKTASSTTVRTEAGQMVAVVREDGRGITLSIAKKGTGDFGKYLAQELPALYEAFTRSGARN